MAEVREAGPGDLEGCVAVLARLPFPVTAATHDLVRAGLARHRAWVAVGPGAGGWGRPSGPEARSGVGERVVGFVVAERRFAHAAEVTYAAVVPERQRTGIGTALVDRALDALAGDGVLLVEVKTPDPSCRGGRDVAARAFWERRGFHQVRRIEPRSGGQPSTPAAVYVAALHATRAARPSGLAHPSGVIPQGLVDKVVARRGRLHAHETLDPARTAFVVVDLDEGTMRRNPRRAELAAVVNPVAAAVRRAGGTVVFVTSDVADLDALARHLGPRLAGEYHADTRAGGPGTAVADGLDVHPDDLQAVKLGASAFFPGRSTLPGLLAERDVVSVLVGGMVTNVCCESSARDAVELGYEVTMVSDANHGHEWGLHEAALTAFWRNFGDVRPSAEVVAMLGGAAPP